MVFIKANLKMDSEKVKVVLNGTTDKSMRANGTKARNMAKESGKVLKATLTTDSGSREGNKEWVSINTKTAHTKVSFQVV